MPMFLWVYIAGLTAAVIVAVLFYAVVGLHATPLINRIFGWEAGRVWGRAFRMMVAITALLGGLSTQWYGCSYSDHQAVAQSPRLMAQKATDQLSQSLLYTTLFVTIAAAVAVVTFATLHSKNNT